MSSTDEQSAPRPGDRLYQHSKRKQWGFAVLAWERDGKRAYQFEDGELRVFAEGFYKFLQEASCPPEQEAKLLAKLGRRSGTKGGDAKAEERQLTFREQLEVFLVEYPAAFGDATWKDEHRGEGAPRRLKRHRDAAATEAQELLSAEALDELIAAGDHGEVVRRMTEIVHGTDLVTRAQAEPVASAAPSPELSAGLRDVLHGSGDYEPRFDEYCRLLLEAGRKQLSWPIATVIPALVRPHAHVAVRPTVLAKQSQWASPRLRYSSKPEGKVYARILTMAITVRDALIGAGRAPKDLLDVYDFMVVTLRPAANRLLDEVRIRLDAEAEAEDASTDGTADEAEAGAPPDEPLH
ncbi:hypothetical protein [Paraliomyxa miuraensis]|uniref:hypothetical protein n=1 Tax=Paraliomyxa miuraensis TaxID=376150 RepID=UPI00224FB265|nr:hypothetical protein [Paraliomyxa miuraensis]MCX4246494.1 hypothetical protein [Paraliomyxa miuraensis]